MAYTGQDLINYQAGDEYLPQEYYSRPYEKPTATQTPQVTQNFGIPYTGAFTRSGGGGDSGVWIDGRKSAGSSLGDIYGYNPNAPIDITRDAWSGTDFVNTPKEAFMTSRGLVDEKGRNMDHLGLNIPSIAGMLFDKNWGQRKVGDVKGLFTEGLSSGIDEIKEGTKEWFDMMKEKTGWTRYQIKKQMKKKEEENLKSAQDAAAAQQAAKTGPATTGQGQAIESGDLKNIGGGFHEYKDSATAAGYEGTHKAGGRVGYRGGQLVRPGPGRPGYGGPQDWGQEERKEGPYSGGGGDGTVTHGGGDGINISGEYITKKPSLTINKSFLNDKANLQAKLYYDNLLENDDLKAEAQLQYGPATLTMDPNSNLNLGYNTNYKGTDITASTNLQDTGSLMASKNGFYGGINYNPDSGASAQFGWGTTWGGPEETYDTQALLDENPDLVYGLKYGGLVGIL